MQDNVFDRSLEELYLTSIIPQVQDRSDVAKMAFGSTFPLKICLLKKESSDTPGLMMRIFHISYSIEQEDIRFTSFAPF
jgi:hypothetical protein